MTIPFSDFGLAEGDNITGVGLYNNSNNSVPTFWIDNIRLTKVVECKKTEIAIDTEVIIQTIRKRHYGINTATWDSHLSATSTHKNLKKAGFTFLRFPGGTIGDKYDWQTNTNKIDGAIYPTDSTDFADLTDHLNANSQISVNYGSGTPQEAYGWLYDLTVIQERKVKYWGVGNENYGSWETDLHPHQHDAVTYANFTKEFYDLAKALEKKVKVGVNGTWSRIRL